MSAWRDTSMGRLNMSEDVSLTSGAPPTSGSVFHSVPSIVLFDVMWTYAAPGVSRISPAVGMRVYLSACGRGDVHLADLLRLLDGLLRPRAGIDVVGCRAGCQQVHRHHRELQARAALEKEHGVVAGMPPSARMSASRRRKNLFEGRRTDG